MDSVKINKIVTIIQDDQKNAKVFSFKRKSDFWNSDFFQNAKQLEIVSSVNNQDVINRLHKANFNLVIDKMWGFDHDIKIIAKK